MPIITAADIKIGPQRAGYVRIWTEAEDVFLRDNWGRTPLPEIAAVLGRTERAVRLHAYRLLGTTLDRPPLAPKGVRRPTRSGPK